MTDTQPEALRLADTLDLAPENGIEPQTSEDAAAELRRLHTENTALQQGYAAARLEIESLQARIKTMAEEHADQPMGRIREKNRWRCGACCAVNLEPDLPTAPSPFDPTDTITACPNCKQCNEGFELLCDEPGCNVVAGCGWPTGDDQDEWGGYRNTCSLHMQQNAMYPAKPAE